MRYSDFAAFWTYSWLFMALDTKNIGVIDDINIMEGTQRLVSVVPLDTDQQQSSNDLSDWIGGKKVFNLNLKEFYGWFRYRQVFLLLKTVGTQVHANQWRLAEGFVYLGLRLASTTEKLAHDGYDQLLLDKAYHYKQVFIWALEDEIIATKIHFGQEQDE